MYKVEYLTEIKKLFILKLLILHIRIVRFILPVLILVLNLQKSDAQLCTGSLGSPVVNITFGSGYVTPGSIPGFTTTYPYAGTNCPIDGTYTIASNSPYCFGGTWWTLNTDHTPNSVNGNMMIVNSSSIPSDFFIDTVSGLCSGTVYEFAAWLLNLNVPSACGGNPVKADITFSIETVSGTVIQQYQTGSIPLANSVQWKQYGFYFTAPANTGTVVIRMRNNAPSGCGNDVAIDDITLSPCGPLVKTFTSLGSNHINTCDNDTTHYIFTSSVSSGFSNIQYQWQVSNDTAKTWTDIPGAVNDNYILSTNAVGSFLYRLTVANGTSITISDCRVISDTIFYNRNVSPVSNLIKSFNVCTGDTIIQNGNAAYNYQWIGPSLFSSTLSSITLQNITVAEDGKYYVSISNSVGCITTDSFSLHVTKKPVAWTIPETSVCLGDTFALKGGGGVTYSWIPANYLLTPNDSITKAFPKDTTVYTLLATNGICSDTQSVRINVLTKPVSNLTKSFNVCTGDTIIEKGDPLLLYQWSGPASFSSTLSTVTLQNITMSEVGNYWAKISNAVGCFTSDSFYLHVNKKPVAWAIADTGICEGDTIVLKGGGGVNYSWKPATNLLTPNDSTTKAYPLNAITYILYATNGICSDTQSVHVEVWQRPTAYIAPVLPIYNGQTTLLSGQVSGTDISYNWTPLLAITNQNTLTPTISPDTTTTYYLTVKSIHDCGIAIDSVLLQIEKLMQTLLIPNSFSPNGDGVHDYWEIGNISSYSNAEVKIFDRNGNIIYHAPNNFIRWDGTFKGNPVPMGTYYYLIDLHINQPVISGWVFLIR